jgi:peroxiredoxin
MQATISIEVGQDAPEFKLKGPGGQFVTLSEYRGRKNVVLVFYPLAFSPVCTHQLPSIEKQIDRFRGLNAEVLGISVDSYYANEAFARSLGLSFPLLSDFDRSVSEKWGMLIRERLYSQRALFIVDKQGRIAYADVAPTTSEVPSKTALIEALERLR